MSANPSSLDTGVIIRRSLFFAVLISLTLGHIFILFHGLSSPHAMEQAQIGREIARGNSFATKMIRPAAFSQAEGGQNDIVHFTKFQDTYHAPLAPLLHAAIFKVIGADDSNAWPMKGKEFVYPLDRVVATVCTLFFLIAIGVNYLLVSRIFDAKIAGVCALVMLFCETFWNYSLSGLPQMLMLMLFSCALYFTYRAIEASAEGRIAMTPAIIAGVFFTLLALTHWMAVWIVLGYIIFAAIAFRPRGVVGIAVLGMLLIPAIFVMIRNNDVSGSPFGTAFLTLYNGLASGSEAEVMRNTNLQDTLVLDGLLSKVLRIALLQANDIVALLGGIVVAPLFFLSLLHPFKRKPIATFRWAILIMWTVTALGLAFFGVSTKELDPNQLHLLFAPIMTAYGIAFVSILWSRLDFVAATPMLRNVHYGFIAVLCALPLLLTLPREVKRGMEFVDKGGIPHWPPYFAPGLNLKLKKYVGDNQILFSDQPWAVAWYADRICVWLPTDQAGFKKLDDLATVLNTPAAGIVITPTSYESDGMLTISRKYGDFASLIFDGQGLIATSPNMTPLYERDPKIEATSKRFPNRIALQGYYMIFYSDRPVKSDQPE